MTQIYADEDYSNFDPRQPTSSAGRGLLMNGSDGPSPPLAHALSIAKLAVLSSIKRNAMSATVIHEGEPELRRVLQKYWGFDSFLPLQSEAMQCVLSGRDSVVVLPTGGGKSLCFQAPAMCMDGLAVVVSPLISLMKDQVDALRSCGIPAACINSMMALDERRHVADEIRAGRLRLLYVAPERLLADRTLDFLRTARVSLFAIDEAHCISSWGHDFRPEYRGLRLLKEQFPEVSVHAYTATATEKVRDDIAEQLRLENHQSLVGSFDRPNLIYKVQRRSKGIHQIRAVLEEHQGESGIIYCISRADVDRTSAALNELGHRTLPYHAGMSDDARQRNQDAFIEERVETIVATVAFGMGIDKSNVRYVVHAAMPKSLESYQQESGRAGRDGLEAECWLFYSGGDYGTWKRIIEDAEPDGGDGSLGSLTAMYNFCASVECRHRALVTYFGQSWEKESCQSCDVCLGELDLVDDPLTIGQKVLSCVLRVKQRFGGDYVSLVLSGSRDKRILQNGHDELSTWGILAEENRRSVRDWIEQLVTQGFLEKVGEFNVLEVTSEGRRLLKGEITPRLLRPAKQKEKQAASYVDSWDGVDRGLFEQLRKLRQEKAMQRQVPAYIIFGDAALRDMARRRPSTLESFRQVRGVGDKKCDDFGAEFVDAIAEYCHLHAVAMDHTPPPEPARRAPSQPTEGPSVSALEAFKYFREGRSVEDVARIMQRAMSTTFGYLDEYIRHTNLCDPSAWVSQDIAHRIADAARQTGLERLKPIFEALNGQVSYEQIRVVVQCLRNSRSAPVNPVAEAHELPHNA